MEKNTALIDELMKIPAGSKNATVNGVRMELIDLSFRDELLANESKINPMIEVVLSNGTFIVNKDGNGKLTALYRLDIPVEDDYLVKLGYIDR